MYFKQQYDMELNRQAFNIDFNLSKMNCHSHQWMYFSRSQSGPDLADPSAFIMPCIELALPTL